MKQPLSQLEQLNAFVLNRKSRDLFAHSLDPRRIAINEAHGIELRLLSSPFRNTTNTEHTLPIPLERNRLKRQMASFKDSSVFSSQIENAIEKSKSILQLLENWDGEGSPTYSKETWEKATRFVRKTAFQFKQESEKWVSPPKITPSHDGSIDVRWKISARSLLINFPADSNIPPSFFGSDKGTDTIKGTLNLSSQNHWLLKWLLR